MTSAYLLSKRKENNITIIAKHMPGDYDIEYASPWAGANVLPYVTTPAPSASHLCPRRYSTPCKLKYLPTKTSMSTKETSRWERRTFPELKRLATEVPEAGIHLQSEWN